MKIIENVTIYKCEFCSKELKVKWAMERHETKCNNNPENFRACNLCKFLEEVPHSYFRDGDYGEHEVKTHMFHCSKYDKNMYPYKAEKKGLVDDYPETFENQEAMPKKCEGFVAEWTMDGHLNDSIGTF